MKDSGKPTFSAELLGTLLASGKIEELQSGAGLFAFAFSLAGRHVLSLDEAIDTLYAHGLPEHTPRAELAERILTGVRSDRAFVALRFLVHPEPRRRHRGPDCRGLPRSVRSRAREHQDPSSEEG